MGGLSGRWYGVPKRVVLAGFAALLVTAAIVMAQGVPDPKADARKARIDMTGGGATMVIARELNVTQIGNPADGSAKTLVFQRGIKREKILGPSSLVVGPTAHTDPLTDEPPTSPNNSAVRYFPNVEENEPTVVVNPKNSKRLVAGTHFSGDTGNRCVAHYSRDGGKTWSDIPIFMPQLKHDVGCSDPVLAYAPDGSRVYYAYMDIDFATTFKIVVSYSDDDGRTWSRPVVALSSPAADYDKPWIGTHVPTGGGSSSNKNFVYVSATRFDFIGSTACHIDFARSSNKGVSWGPAQTLDTAGCSGPASSAVVVQGSRPTGGVGSDVLVAWYHSLVGFQVGDFQIRTRYSADNGATFGPIVVAATDTFELSMFLGPAFAYHRWWGGMFPDVEIAPNGTGHILYTHDPQAGSTIEDGDIRYLGSAGRPYGTWSAPLRVNDDASGKAQGWATLEATSDGNKTILYAIWEDHRTSPTDNLNFDVFWSRKVGTATAAWATNKKLTDVQSVSDFFFLGDYYDLAIADSDNGNDNDLVASGNDDGDGVFVYGIWTDRRREPTVFDFDDDVWGSRVPPKSMSDDNDNDDDNDD